MLWKADISNRPILRSALLRLPKVNDSRGPTCPVKANLLRPDSCAGVLFPYIDNIWWLTVAGLAP